VILLKQPSLRKLEKLVHSKALADKTILHYTGGMFGIGCQVSSQEAIKRILKLKQREDKQGLIALIPHIDWFDEQKVNIPDRLFPLLEEYWPGNLTVVFRCHDERFEHIAVDGKVAFRVPNDDLLRVLIEMTEEPLVSTSVNLSGLPAESDLKRLTSLYKAWFDYGILPGRSPVGYDTQPSTMVEFINSWEEKNTSGFDELKCLREGSIPFYRVRKSFEKPTILFVCTANICRSPMAEKLFNHYAMERELDYAGDSCGFMGNGHSISAGSLQVLLERGIADAVDHESKEITPELVSGSRLILTMEQKHRDDIRRREPEQAGKVFTLNEYLGEPGDVEDPYGSELDNYRKVFAVIDDRIKRLIDKLENKNTTASE
jgi:tRNA threonylcarbamoyl adenosine modification protein (Sua5/YciO/YrdC/YwlC family)